MFAGLLRHRVTIQRYTTTQNDYGEEVETWADLASRWAAVEPLSGREYFDAQQVASDVSIRVRMRSDSVTDALTAMDRIIHKSRTLEIVSPPINVNERGREIHLMCRELG